jgi:membrane protein DedA with SNARE-associated domain
MILAHFFVDPDTIKAWIEWGGYFVLFGLLLACGMGLPVPEDVPLIFSGVLISQGHMHWWVAAPVAWLGILGGDTILYSLGRRFGEDITRLPVIGKHVTLPRLRKAEDWFNRYGIVVVAVGRLLAGVRGAMVVAAGVSRFNFVKFIIADGLAAIVSGGLFMLIGYKCGENYHDMSGKVTIFLIVGGLTLGVCVAIVLRRRARRKKPMIQTVLEKADKIVGPAVTGTSAPADASVKPAN